MKHDYQKICDAAESLDHMIAELSVWNAPAPGASKATSEHDSNVGEAICLIKKACAALTMAIYDNERDMAREGALVLAEQV